MNECTSTLAVCKRFLVSDVFPVVIVLLDPPLNYFPPAMDLKQLSITALWKLDILSSGLFVREPQSKLLPW